MNTYRSLTLPILAITALFLSSCGTSGRVSVYSPSGSGNAIESGVASWYGPKFHGKRTANGEIYNMYSLTAAHRTLPFNSFVRVHNLDNGESIVVRINDRGPFAKNRIIDLSKKAASEIGMLGPGTARVQLYLVEGDRNRVADRNLKEPTYTVQLGSFAEENRAIHRSSQITGSRVEKVYLNGGKEVFRVYYGTFTRQERAEQAKKDLEKQGFNGYVKQIEN